MTTVLEGGEGSASRPGRSLHPGKTRYPFYRRLCGLHGWSGQVQKISPPPGFDPRTVQHVASRYTDYATQPTSWSEVEKYFRAGQTTDDNTVRSHCMLDRQGYKQTLSVCYIYCFLLQTWLYERTSVLPLHIQCLF
jgi:hypothetical protein